MLKKYVLESKLNEYEREHKRISYKTLCDFLFYDMVLCNNILNVDENLLDNQEIGSLYDEETEDYDEVYQWYIVNADSWAIEKLKELDFNGIQLFYSDVLENYILGVTHWGTSWDYVLTDIGYTEDLDESDF